MFKSIELLHRYSGGMGLNEREFYITAKFKILEINLSSFTSVGIDETEFDALR